MRRKLLLCFIVGLFLIAASLVWAQCPEGKSEVQLTTPSGKQKTICIPDVALPGIENAAEHSNGTIIPASCPCWTETELNAYVERFGLIECIDHTSEPPHLCIPDSLVKHYECIAVTPDEKILLTHSGGICGSEKRYCANEASMFDQIISAEEYDACLSIIKKFMK